MCLFVFLFVQKNAKVDKLMTDNSTSLIKAAENDDRAMMTTLLGAKLSENFFDMGGFFYAMAERFQKPGQGVILTFSLLDMYLSIFFYLAKYLQRFSDAENLVATD